MSSLPVPSALDARTQAFPVLTAAQISRIRSGSKVREVKKGEILFEPGETNVPFFVLLSGSMEIVQSDLAGERLIVTHGPGNFTGEMTMISGRGILVRGRVTEPGETECRWLAVAGCQGRRAERDFYEGLHPAQVGTH